MTEPDRIARLNHDRHGRPIPWNILRANDGTPFFIVNDDRRTFRAIREHRCPICGEKLGRWHWFVGGPGSAFHRHGWYFDLPGHHECIQFSLATCPYLSMPKYLRCTDNITNVEKLPPEARIMIDNTVTPERPDIFVAVASDRIEMNMDRAGLTPYVRGVRPYLAHEFWRHGKQISVEEALPYLRAALGADWKEPERRIE